ncbi:MAG: hypothetical protein QW275_00730 [Candidatus Anstonellaceae archaeon]
MENNTLFVARKAVLFFLSSAFVFLFSFGIFSYAFIEKFFDVQTYENSLERRGIYGEVAEKLKSSILLSLPYEVQEQASEEIGRAIDEEYARVQVISGIKSASDYLLLKSQELNLHISLEKVKSELGKSESPYLKAAAILLPSKIDLAGSLSNEQKSQLQSARLQISAIKSFGQIAIPIAILLLIPFFLLQPDCKTGLHEIGKLLSKSGFFSLTIAASLILLFPAILPNALSSLHGPLSQDAYKIGQIISDGLSESGRFLLILSLPILLAGFLISFSSKSRNP